jgi:hypothetical protein
VAFRRESLGSDYRWERERFVEEHDAKIEHIRKSEDRPASRETR